MVKILDGVVAANQIKNEIKEQISKQNLAPCLAVVLASDDPASEIYVKKKQAACEEVGIKSFVITRYGGSANSRFETTNELISTIDYLNVNREVHGILVQLPLPSKFDTQKVFDIISPLKDVDVFSPFNVGLLSQGRPRFIPCTPAGIQELLIRNGLTFKGKKVTIINRSDIVGKPLHSLLSQNDQYANATCTLCHDHTPPELLKSVCLSSDIIIVAVGIPGFLTADMVPEGAIVVDVGINRIAGSKKIVGDVEFDGVSKKASWITTVPGGVGPLTVAMLLKNTLKAQILSFTSVS